MDNQVGGGLMNGNEVRICTWCMQEIEQCRKNWERFHRGILDTFCYDDNGNVIGRCLQDE
jgi:hypothetical protein